ncbi:MAG: peptidoglycan glycosyltransferase [Ruminococcus sp.]|nr:peptidoglycan glycosyltransferase [Ruminococcus sp.]
MKSDAKTYKKKKKKKSNPVVKTLKVIGTTVLSLVLVCIITFSIVATALTVYVIKFMENTSDVDIDLYNLDVITTSFIYAQDPETGEWVEIHRMSQNQNRILVTLDEVPQHVQDAFICTEDERFFEHEGVDFKRTFAAFANMFLEFWDTKQGGSTITQQLVKNLTGDEDKTSTRKMREIFRAMNLEDEYPKEVILEAYLNYIGFGGNCYGVQAAANRYFDKDVSELTIAEAACLASIPKSPNTLNPEVDPEANRERRNNVVLPAMLKNGVISSEEYEQALNEEIIYAYQEIDEETGEIVEAETEMQNWYVDMVIFEVADDMMKKYGYETQEEAISAISNGGYKIYAAVDPNIQQQMEEKFKDNTTFAAETLNNPPQAAAIIMDYNGYIKGVVGGIGEKPNPLCYNRATMSQRSIGSTVKPIASYGYAMYTDQITWSTIFYDTPIEVVEDWNTMKKKKWPANYSNRWTEDPYFTFQALQRSLNTIPAQIVEQATPQEVFKFVQNNMQITSLVASDADYSAMTVGGLTNGITLLELTTAYQAFGNEGKIHDPTSYYKVVDAEGEVILENDGESYVQAIDPDTAYVMNKLLQTVVYGPNGTGTAAKIEGVTIAAKTGTSQDWADIAFVGCTPSYVSSVWYGYDDSYKYDENKKEWVANSTQGTYYSSAKVWKNIFEDIMKEGEVTEFPANENVIEAKYCTITGLIASEYCPHSVDVGYYKPSNVPETCSGVHGTIASDSDAEETVAPSETLPPETSPVGAATAVDLSTLY